MKLYLGSPVRVQSLLLMLALAGFIIVSLVRRETVERWGWRILVLAAAGLVLCTLAATRDGYHQGRLPPVGPECHRRLGGGGAVQRQERSVRYLLYLRRCHFPGGPLGAFRTSPDLPLLGICGAVGGVYRQGVDHRGLAGYTSPTGVRS